MENELENMDKPLGYRGDNKYDMLGFGCDVTGKYLDVMKASNPVIDIAALAVANPGVILEDYPTSELIEIIGGSNASSLTEKHGKKFGASSTIPTDAVTFSGEFSNESGSSKTINSKHSYAIADINVYKYHCSIKRNTDIKTLQNYLSAGFKEDIEKLKTDTNADKFTIFFETYGTHVYTDIFTGGKIHCIFKSVIESDTKEESVCRGAKFAIGDFFGLSSEKSSDTASSDEFTEQSFSYESRGGQGNQLTGSTAPIFGDKVNMTSWSKTVSLNNDYSLQLIEIGDKSLIQISDFISDENFKEIVLQNLNQYISNNTPALLFPFYRFHKDLKHFYSVNKKEGINANLDSEGIQCYVLDSNSKSPDAVELYRSYNSKTNDHFYTTNKAEVANPSDYVYEGVSCKVFNKQMPNTTRLYRYWNKTYHLYTTDPFESGLVTNNFTIENEEIWVYDKDLVS